MGSPFECVGVDILEMPRTLWGNRYVIVFAEYFTKWAEAYAVEDQTSETITRLLIDNVVCRHGVPVKLLSDRGSNLLSTLIMEVCELLGMKKINSTSYHPQTDGLVERMNWTLRGMIAKQAHKFGPDWDLHLQQLMFTYQAKSHESRGESPFFLIYGRDPRLPTESALSTPVTCYQENLDDYREGLVAGLSETWRIAKQNTAKAQCKQNKQYDRRAREMNLQVGDRVMVFMPHETQGKQRELALPYYGPYRVLELTPNIVTVRPVDQPN